MDKKKVWRYYCEFCRKGGCSAGHMRKHETGCTKNPNRACGICRTMELESAPLPALIAFVKEHALANAHSEYDDSLHLDEPDTKRLRELAGNCPVCMLAALRQGGAFGADFSMRDELKSLWSDHNQYQAGRL